MLTHRAPALFVLATLRFWRESSTNTKQTMRTTPCRCFTCTTTRATGGKRASSDAVRASLRDYFAGNNFSSVSFGKLTVRVSWPLGLETTKWKRKTNGSRYCTLKSSHVYIRSHYGLHLVFLDDTRAPNVLEPAEGRSDREYIRRRPHRPRIRRRESSSKFLLDPLRRMCLAATFMGKQIADHKFLRKVH